MKESKLIEMHNKVETLGKVIQQVIGELTNLKDLSVGTMELVKRLDGYEDALKKLTEEHQLKQQENEQKEDANGTTTGDSGLIITDE